MKKVIFQNFVHHLNAQPIEIIGQWHVFNAVDVPENWPSQRTQLAITVNEAQLQYLRDNAVSTPIEPEDLPEDPTEEEIIAPQNVTVDDQVIVGGE